MSENFLTETLNFIIFIRILKINFNPKLIDIGLVFWGQE